MSDTLELVLPDWGALDTEARSPLPFALWTIGDQCLLHHWLDHAVNEGASKVHIHVADRPATVRKLLDDSTLWPLRLEMSAIPDAASAPPHATLADWLPGEPSPPAPRDGWELLDRAAAIERLWLDRLAASLDFLLLNTGFSCRIHPEATLVPPYFIGDHVLIGPGCEIGPYAVIGSGSVISGANLVAHSHLSARSFVGPVTAFENCRLEQGILFNLKHRARLDHIEPHLVSSLDRKGHFVPLRDRLTALLLYFRAGQGRKASGNFVTFDGRRMPGSPDAALANRAAWLPLVWRGEIPLRGVLPRTTAQFDALTPDWQSVIRHAPIGVFSHADVHGCHSPDDPEEAVHAVYQAALPPDTLRDSIDAFIRKFDPSDPSRTPSNS
jgi:hypothetical protein